MLKGLKYNKYGSLSNACYNSCFCNASPKRSIDCGIDYTPKVRQGKMACDVSQVLHHIRKSRKVLTLLHCIFTFSDIASVLCFFISFGKKCTFNRFSWILIIFFLKYCKITSLWSYKEKINANIWSNQRKWVKIGFTISFISTYSRVSRTSRAYSSCFMYAIATPMRLPFFKISWNFVDFCPNGLPFFWPFFEKLQVLTF